MQGLITDIEMRDLTGAKLPAKQCEVLRKNGIRFLVRADNRPSLTWEAYNRQLCGTQAEPVTGFNLEAM